MTNSESHFTLKGDVLRFNGEARSCCWSVEGSPINSAAEDRTKLRKWKEDVACLVKKKRGDAPWNPCHHYAVTLRFRFRPLKNQKLDVDNFVKPVLDGLAAGLFLPECKDPRSRDDLPTFAAQHGVDDSNFRIVLVRRLGNAEKKKEEGVRLFVSTTGHPPPS